MTVEEIKKLNIYERIALITAEMGPVEKDLSVGEGKKSYAGVSERAVLDAVKGLEEKYRIISFAVSRSKTETVIEKEYFYEGQCRKIRLTKMDITETYRFANIDRPEEFVETTSFGTGIDTGDKAPGKAMTYADKYALMKMYKISTGAANDPDSFASPEDGFIFGALADTPNPDNPLDYSVEGKTMDDKTQTAVQKPESQAATRAKTGEAEKGSGMTLEEAKSVILPIGEFKGKSLGEVSALKPGLISFYAGDKFRNDKYPQLKEAARLIAASM